MKKTIFGVAFLLTAMVAVGADAPPDITPPSNGMEWTRLSSSEKLFWAVGYSQGYQEALDKIDVASGPNTACAGLAARTERSTSTAGRISGFELVSGLEKFYAEPANSVIPVGSAVRIYLLQAGGKDETTIQELIETARMLGSVSRSTP